MYKICAKRTLERKLNLPKDFIGFKKLYLTKGEKGQNIIKCILHFFLTGKEPFRETSEGIITKNRVFDTNLSQQSNVFRVFGLYAVLKIATLGIISAHLFRALYSTSFTNLFLEFNFHNLLPNII